MTTTEKKSVLRTGVVKSDKRHKTRSVVISWKTPHPKYGKYVSKRSVIQVHDEHDESHEGDLVEIAECRPISKTKSWRLVRVIRKKTQV